MKNRPFLIFILMASFFRLYSLDVGLSGGLSYFTYAELSENNKDDLYEIKSGLFGLSFKQDLLPLQIIGRVNAQLPYDVTFTDAFGTDDYNYLSGLFYWGLNSRVGVAYPIKFNKIDLSIGVVFNHDYFYFEDLLLKTNNEYTFSLIGNGLVVDALIPLSKNWGLGLGITGVVNYLSFGNSGGELKWSNNIIGSCSLIYLF